MKKCEICGTKEGKICYSKDLNKTLCVKCRRYEINHPVNPLPPKGEVKYDNQGRPICHICGRAFNRVTSHAHKEHDISAYEYKKMFELNNNTGLLIESSKDRLRKHIKDNYDKVVKDNLINKGKDFRYENGHEGRTKEKVRLECKKSLISNLDKILEKRKGKIDE